MFIEALEGRRLFAGVKFMAPLLGDNEVPAHVTPAKGSAKFVLSKDGSSLRFSLKGNKIQNTVMAHIHLGAPGVNGEIVVDLLAADTPRIRPKKVTAKGVITAANLTGSLAGHTLADLVAQMTAGGAYVNVHTNDNVDPPNTGPGDFPGGEIRGQIRRLGRQTTGNTGGNPTGGNTTGGNNTGGNGNNTGGGGDGGYPYMYM